MIRRGSKAQTGRKVLAGLRPETVALRPAGSDGSAPRFRLELVEELGMGRLLHGRIGERAFTVAQGASDAPPEGEAFTIEIAPSKIHLFDEATGARLAPPAICP